MLWTRLAPEPLAGGGMPMANVEVGWEVAQDRAFASIATKGTAVARPELGHSVHVEVERARARAASTSTAFASAARSARSGAPRPRRPPAPPSIACASPSAAAATTRPATSPRSAGSPTEQFDFVFHTGDYIYEGRDDGGQNPALVRQHQGDEIYTLVDYRNRYAQYKMDPDLRAAHASAPFIVTWDDHEVDNDYAGDRDENDTPPEVFLLRRAAAYQAYFETMPLRAAAIPSGPNMRLYRRLQFGNLLDLSVLDTRQFRSKQACGATTATGCAAALDPARTILGSTQEQWLFEQLGHGEGDVDRPRPAGADLRARQPARRAERALLDGQVGRLRRLARSGSTRGCKETKAPNPIVLSGDVHVHYGADLKTRLRQPAVGDRRRRVHEHVGHVRRRRRRRQRDLGAHPRRQPAHQVPQRPPRLHRLHGDAAARCAPTSRSSTG